MPAKFVENLEAIVLLGGTTKQRKSAYRRYGVYFSNKIFIHAYPKCQLERRYKHAPKPSILNEYKRAGARIEKLSSTLSIQFDKHSLRKFFEQDVLVHEIGHHVDRANFHRKTHKKIEGFAEWFATHYGFHARL